MKKKHKSALLKPLPADENPKPKPKPKPKKKKKVVIPLKKSEKRVPKKKKPTLTATASKKEQGKALAFIKKAKFPPFDEETIREWFTPYTTKKALCTWELIPGRSGSPI